MPKLTKRTVEALPIEAKDYFVWDDEVAGFGVRVMPSGAKTYQAQYRKGGRTRRVSLGRHGTLTADEARKRARVLLGRVAGGENPAEEIALHRRAPTIAALCERFFETHVLQQCKPTTQREYRRSLDLFIKPAIGSFKLVDVEQRDIAELHHSMRDKPYQANRTLGVLSKMFNLAEVWGLRPNGSNPCRRVSKYPEEERERFLSESELTHLGQVISEMEAEGGKGGLDPFQAAAYRLLILTGCRLSEIQALKWEYLTPAMIKLPDSKTGARRIPLPPAARAVLDALPRDPENPYVIRGHVPGHHITDLQRPWRRVRARAGLSDVRIHDLRHTYASSAVARGVSIQMVGKLLGHSKIQSTMRYAHLDDNSVRQAAEQVSDGLADALGPLPYRPIATAAE